MLSQNDLIQQKKMQASKGSSYKQVQLFGYKGSQQQILEDDVISTLHFDRSGNYLAVGDHNGRIIIFNYQPQPKGKKEELEYFTQFHSHRKEFDPLRSEEVQVTINDIAWLNPQGKYLKLVSTNSRHIKLWKIYETVEKKIVKSAGKELNMPKLQTNDSYYNSHMQLCFPAKHLTSINSINSTKNQEYLLSSDDVHCFLWNYEKYAKPYMLVDLLGKNQIESLQENITFSKMHPSCDSLFIYGTNRGNLKLCDLRLSSDCQTASNFKNEYSQQKNLLTDLLSSYSSGDFVKQGKYIVSRDLLSMKIWDVCNTKKPLNTIVFNESLKGKLSEMYQNQSIYDKFSIRVSPDGNTFASGSYSNQFHMVDKDGTNMQFEVNYRNATIGKQIVGKGATVSRMDYVKKTTALDFHPNKNIVAVGSLNCFFLYSM